MIPAIDIKSISKSYGEVRALRGVSFSVNEGELFGLIGPDGAGKTSLYKILTTLMAPDGGSATVLGFDTIRQFRDIRRSVGYMPEQFSLYPDLTVMENLEFFAALFGVSIKDNYELISPVFSQLARFPGRRAGALSGGMKQKLALSCALIHRPRVLLLDEPTTGVDAVSRSEFWEMLRSLRAHGITIMVSTSYMDEAQLCDRIALINEGAILDVDTPSALVTGLGENLWNAAGGDMYRLLGCIRTLPHVEQCYTFGATLHVVTDSEFNPADALGSLLQKGIRDAKIYPAKGDIEELFIKLASGHD